MNDRTGITTKPSHQITYEGYEPDEEPLREALCTLANGYFGTRGAHESTHADGIHYPGTYLAGGYDRLESDIGGTVIENEDLVNFPNWLPLTFRHADREEWFSPDSVEIQEYRQVLDMEKGMLLRWMRFRTVDDRETTLESRRIVHMDRRHFAAIQWKLTPQNWSGDIVIRSALDGRVSNEGVERYRALNGNHLEPLDTRLASDDIICLKVRTRQSDINMAQAARTEARQNGMPAAVERRTIEHEGYIAQNLHVPCVQHHTLTVDKTITLYTSCDVATSEAAYQACTALIHAPRFSDLVHSHIRTWSHLWYRSALELTGDDQSLRILSLHIFHLLQTTSINSVDLDTGIPPRGWHGEAYRGHIMWDELFIFPFLTFRMPELTRAFLMYRYRRLDTARVAAREAGYRGAMFPWQSGSDGREESQKIHLNPMSGRWLPDPTNLQRHISAGIAYSVWQYYQITDDKEYLYFFGAELILEIARFWSSIATFNPERQRYEIRGVIGPDEYHTKYPDASGPGINNNAFTNVMAVWVLTRAQELLKLLDSHRREELCEDLRLAPEELERWHDISRRMFVPFLHDGIVDQFERYENLEELDWEYYHNRYGDNMRLDRILENEDDSVDRYKASKQADALMLFYLLSSDELREIWGQLGYEFDPQCIPRTIEYYRGRTSHGSTLSRVVFSWVLTRSNRRMSWHVYEKALVSDFRDVQGGTTPEGVHLGAMAGTVDIIQRCYPGLEVRGDVLYIHPRLPDDIGTLSFRIRYRSHWLWLAISHEAITVTAEEGWGNPITVDIEGERHTYTGKETRTCALPVAEGVTG